jgi:hypothetical protein
VSPTTHTDAHKQSTARKERICVRHRRRSAVGHGNTVLTSSSTSRSTPVFAFIFRPRRLQPRADLDAEAHDDPGAARSAVADVCGRAAAATQGLPQRAAGVRPRRRAGPCGPQQGRLERLQRLEAPRSERVPRRGQWPTFGDLCSRTDVNTATQACPLTICRDRHIQGRLTLR